MFFISTKKGNFFAVVDHLNRLMAAKTSSLYVIGYVNRHAGHGVLVNTINICYNIVSILLDKLSRRWGFQHVLPLS